MKRWGKVLLVPAGLLLIIFSVNTLLAVQAGTGEPSKADVIQRTKKLQMPFITNEGQTDERVLFYANTFGGAVFVTKDGEIVYALPQRINAGADARVRHGLPPISSVNKPGGKGGVTLPLSKGDAGGLMKHPLPTPDPSGQADPQHNKRQGTSEDKYEKGARGVVLKEEIVGGRMDRIKGERKAITTVNDFRGNDPSKHKTNIPTYEVVTLGEVYEGVELKLKAYGNNVEKLFYVKPGTDPGVIRLKLSGAKALRVNEEGQLEAETALGTVRFTKPRVYQESKVPSPAKKENISSSSVTGNGSGEGVHRDGQDIETAYVVTGNEYGFQLGDYDRTQGIVIDPLLASTFLGGHEGSGEDKSHAIAIDAEGNVYVAGLTGSPNFPTTLDSFDNYFNGGHPWNADAFVSKLNSDLTNLLASTYLGGSGDDAGNDIAIDPAGNVYVTGSTSSSDFPTTPGAYDTFFNGSQTYHVDTFVSKLNGDMITLVASTFLGGNEYDTGNAIAIDPAGNVYVTGSTNSSDFPTTQDAYDTSYSGCFVSKFSGDLTSLLASTYLQMGNAIVLDAEGNVYVAGSNTVSKLNGSLTSLFASKSLTGGSISAMVIDTVGNIYVTGYTTSEDFPTTPGAYDTSHNGNYDAFVSKLNGDLTSLLASTYLGGHEKYIGDYGSSIAIDAGGNVYVTGWTGSPDFPIIAGAYDTSLNGFDDVFVSKFSGDLTNLLASTFLGGNQYDGGNAMAIDSAGNIYITGLTYSPDFPTTPGAYETSFKGDYPYSSSNSDAYVSKLDGDFIDLLASTYLGGNGWSGRDSGNSIAIDAEGNVYVTGSTESPNFLTTSGVYDTSFNGSTDIFVSKLSGDLTDILASTFLGGNEYDTGNAIAIDPAGNVYVTGSTNSSDFPTTQDAYDTSYSSCFVSKFSGDLTSLLASTYLQMGNAIVLDAEGNVYVAGGSTISKINNDLTYLLASTSLNGGSIRAIVLDMGGNVYVTGSTESPNFLTTPGAYDTSYNGNYDAFVSKLNGDLTSLLVSTFLGGNKPDNGNAIAIDSVGNIYVTGETYSSDFPIISGAYETVFYGGVSDAFVSKLNSELTDIIASTYLGRPPRGEGNSIAIDSKGNIHVVVGSHSYHGDASDAFVLSLNGGLSDRLSSYTRVLEDIEYDQGVFISASSIAIDHMGNVFVAGNASLAVKYIGTYYSDAFVSKIEITPSHVTVPYVSTNLTVDGNLDESAWDVSIDVSKEVIGTANNTTKFGVLWDSTYLYVGMTVLDDNPFNDSTYVHEDDSVEIYIDGDHNRSTPYDDYDRQFVKGWNDSTFVERRGKTSGVLHGWAPIPGGYSIEMAIPWSNLGITPMDGMTLGFSVGYNDDDNGGGREGQAVWRGTANNWLDTSGFGEIVLAGALPPTPTPTSTPTPTPTVTPVPTPSPIPSPIMVTSFNINNGATRTTSRTVTLNNTATGNPTHYMASESPDFTGVEWRAYSTVPRFKLSKGDGTKTVYFKVKNDSDVHSNMDSDSILFNKATDCTDDYEPNDDFSAAFGPLVSGKSYAGKICSPVDNDYFQINVVNPGTITLNLRVPPEKDYDLELYNSSYQLVDFSENLAGESESIEYEALEPGTYYISVYGYDGEFDETRTYTLSGAWPSTPQSFYTFDEGSGTIANDSSGGGRHGTIYGAQWTTGKIGGGLNFDGNDYVTIPRMNYDEISVSAWFNKNASGTNVIFGGFKYNANVQLQEGFDLYFHSGTPNRLRFAVVTRNASGTRTVKEAIKDFTGSNGSWYHVVGVYNKVTGEQKLYVDGQLVHTRTHPSGNVIVPLTSRNYMAIGTRLTDFGFFRGSIDDVRIYNRMLSTQEVQGLYNNVSALVSTASHGFTGINNGDTYTTVTPPGTAASIHPATVILSSFKAKADDNRIIPTWKTSEATDNAGFNLYRARRRNGRYTQVNDALIDAKGYAASGGSYSFEEWPGHGEFYYYKLESVDYDGVSIVHKPVKVQVRSEDNQKRRSSRYQP